MIFVILQENILKEVPHLNENSYRLPNITGGEFCIVNGEISDLQCVMNTLFVFLVFRAFNPTHLPDIYNN